RRFGRKQLVETDRAGEVIFRPFGRGRCACAGDLHGVVLYSAASAGGTASGDLMPCSIASISRSSSSSSQWIPDGDNSKLARASGSALSRRGYHQSGVL